LPNYLAAFVGQATGQKVDIQARFGSFLESLDKPDVHRLIANGSYEFVVLQAQKYSMSGKYEYSYDGAFKLGKLAKQNGAKVLLFPEWGRRGHKDEARRVQKIHEEIAAELECEIVPVGLVWDRVMQSNPDLVLHAADGNHSSEIGVYLTACVFYAQITGRTAEGLSVLGIKGLEDESVVRSMQSAVTATLDEK